MKKKECIVKMHEWEIQKMKRSPSESILPLRKLVEPNIVWNRDNIAPIIDFDRDGVPNLIDCKPYDPTQDGFLGDVGRAAKLHVTTAIEDIKEETVKTIAGEETREKRKTLRQIEEEEEFKESKKQAMARGKRKARKEYGMPEAPLNEYESTTPKRVKTYEDYVTTGGKKKTPVPPTGGKKKTPVPPYPGVMRLGRVTTTKQKAPRYPGSI